MLEVRSQPQNVTGNGVISESKINCSLIQTALNLINWDKFRNTNN